MKQGDYAYAHTLPGRPQAEWESLPDHADAVARLAASFATPFGWAMMALAAGLLHDAGKASAEFQFYIRGERPRGGDHSTWGARLSQALYGEHVGRILAHCIAGHHAGLSDAEDLLRRLDPARTEIPDAGRWSRYITPPARDALRPTRATRSPNRDASFGQAFLIRMLFSCVVDADVLATKGFTSGGSIPRGVEVRLGALRDRLRTHLDAVRGAAVPSPLNALRAEILAHAIGKADADPGFFTLTVPTGGGKTLTSLAFALEHACLKGKRRVVYVAPFTAIIEQTAAIFQEALGQGIVLEHHSSFDWEEAEKRQLDGGDERDGLGPLRRAAENWDAPIVVTTAVQCFESLFASRTSRCRKLHNLVDSVIILDEAQTLPTNLLLPCLAALEELATNYGATIVLCTATQPAVRRQDATLIDKKSGADRSVDIGADRELAPRPHELYDKLRRVRVEMRDDTTSDEVVAARFAAQPRMLCIVGSRAHARELFERIKNLDGAFHLTTCMCPAHRRAVLADLKARLKTKAPVRLVATSLIEAGVDISFPEVWRARAGVDQIAQAAGRCNREGELLPALGRVVVFEPADHKAPRSLTAFRQAAAGVLRDHVGDPLGLDAVAAYFRQLYFQKGMEALDSVEVEGLPGILAALRRNAIGLGFPFRSIAEAFRMIDEAMVPVVVPWNDEAKAVLKRLEVLENVAAGDLRKLQLFTVGIPQKARDAWLADGVIRPVRAAFGDALLRFQDDTLYRPRTGIDLAQPTYREAEANVW